MNQTNIINQELIGLHTHIAKSSDSSLIGRKGRIIDESKEMIKLRESQNEIMVAKANCVFDIKLLSGMTIQVDGHLLRGKPEDRLKKRVNGRW